MIVSLQEAGKEYIADGARVHALRDVSFEAGAGELIAIVGRSGCGKSTLLHLAGAMDFPTSGTVAIEGQVTSELSDNALTRLRREKVGFIFQSFQLLNTLSVVENVELPLMLAGMMAVRGHALERLRWVEMESYAARMPWQLSGGEQQRVAISRALIASPRLILADEPTGNLDTATGDVILSLLRRIADERGATVLMATHNQDAAAIADRMVCLRDGAIVEIRDGRR